MLMRMVSMTPRLVDFGRWRQDRNVW